MPGERWITVELNLKKSNSPDNHNNLAVDYCRTLGCSNLQYLTVHGTVDVILHLHGLHNSHCLTDGHRITHRNLNF